MTECRVALLLAAVCVSVCHSSPTYDLSPPEQPLEYDAHPHQKAHPYQFEYAVKDEYKDLEFSRNESQDTEGKVTGEYRVLLPDGRTQVVTYTADHYSGFKAIVRYEGEARTESYYNERKYPATETVYSSAGPAATELQPEVTTVSPEETTEVPEVTTAAPESIYPTSRTTPSAVYPQYQYQAQRPQQPAAPQLGYLPPQPVQRHGGRPATLYGVPAQPQHGYLPPPPAHRPVYFSNQPTEAPLSVAAVVVEEEEREGQDGPGVVPVNTSTTPGPATGQPLPQVAVDPIPEVTGVTQQRAEVRDLPAKEAQPAEDGKTEAVEEEQPAGDQQTAMMY